MMVDVSGDTKPEVSAVHLSADSFSKLSKARLIIRAINHPLRQRIIEILMLGNKMKVGDLVKELNIQQPVVSQHLSALRKAQVIQVHKTGREAFYSLNPTVFSAISDLLQALYKS
ncbi:MAG: winged helix-turn-helix transcriptional regulator [Bacteroidetes bacterium]|nr:winged helix-turn-helix transcriptional regulator [Bacteroidota bacterium]